VETAISRVGTASRRSESGQQNLALLATIAQHLPKAMTSSPPADDSNADPSALPRPFVRLAWANLAAQSAEQLSLAAVPIVAVLALGAGAGEIGALGVAQTLPYLLLSIPFGLLADRTSRRR
jgi:hypothetical protein